MDAGQMGFSLNPEKAEPTAAMCKKYLGMQPPLLALIFYDMILNIVGALMVAIIGHSTFTAIFLIVTGAIHFIPIVIFTPHEFAKISPGANDNAAGVAVMLELARRFKDNPLQNAEIRFLGDGSEETYMHGMACFMEAHQHELDKNNTYFLVPESCGVGTPRVVFGEGVSWIETHSPELCKLVFDSAKELGYNEVERIILRTGGTDMSPPTVRGFKATGIIAMNENDYVPNYHWTGDLPEAIEVETLRKVTNIFETSMKKIDAL
jgi:Zn-dependent M28 family amino/carboxypeptidase